MLSIPYLPVPGDIVPPEKLQTKKAKELAALLRAETLKYARLIECHHMQDGTEVVVFDVEVERGQKTVHDIRRFERIAACFDADDEVAPEVLALRSDFPRVPHLNLRNQEFPRSLCLYEEPYSELKLHWTTPAFIERIRAWLALTSKGKLHGDDQPLEPLLLEPATPIIIPKELFTDESVDSPPLLIGSKIDHGQGKMVLLVRRPKDTPSEDAPALVATVFNCPPQQHGTIYHKPRTLYDLHAFMECAGYDMLGELRNRMKTWEHESQLLNAHLILITCFPKTRNQGGVVEATDVWAFVTAGNIGKIGEAIGIWMLHNGTPGTLVLPDDGKRGEDIQIELLSPHLYLTESQAASFNGVAEDARQIVAVGLGTLGSQVIMNLVRGGCGKWTLIDKDYLLPHNMARHALLGYCTGFPKAQALADFANSIFEGERVATPVMADVLMPGDRKEELHRYLEEADIIADFSASVTVARHLTHNADSLARRISLFLNPAGTDLVLLAEDEGRFLTLDCLEMQYYREVANNPDLAGHLQHEEETRRYARSCRDLTAVIAQDHVALLAAIGSRAFRRTLTDAEASVRIWQIDTESLEVTSSAIPTYPVKTEQKGEWHLIIDHYLEDRIAQLRKKSLPNETGGVLVGTFDLQRKLIYVVDTIPSPPDSDEWPTLYIRGCQGLYRRLMEVQRKTDAMLQYVGEWHSHPDGAACRPSSDDRTVFSWIKSLMGAEGLPPVMLIAGERGEYSWFVETIG